MVSMQKERKLFGQKRGLIRPTPLYFSYSENMKNEDVSITMIHVRSLFIRLNRFLFEKTSKLF
jgi:hypothetical protein